MASPFVDVAVAVQRCNGLLKITIYKKENSSLSPDIQGRTAQAPSK